jgi:hypothetical protein
VDGGVEIHLEKRIPVGGGLGGGSSDAAAALRGLQALFPAALTPEEVLRIAGSLGSDVPYFLCGSPLALAWGRGDRLLPLPPPPPAPVLLALPPVAVATAEAYRLLAAARREGSRLQEIRREASRPGPPRLLSVETLSSWDGLSALAGNDFEEVILPAHPLLRRLREALRETSPLLSLLSGSGACLFAVYGGERGRWWPRASWRSVFRSPPSSSPVPRSSSPRGVERGWAGRYDSPDRNLGNGPSSNGRTPVFGTGGGGSNPPGPTRLLPPCRHEWPSDRSQAHRNPGLAGAPPPDPRDSGGDPKPRPAGQDVAPVARPCRLPVAPSMGPKPCRLRPASKGGPKGPGRVRAGPSVQPPASPPGLVRQL